MKLLTLAALLGLSASATAQIAYDAGEAGNPPKAPSPTTHSVSRNR